MKIAVSDNSIDAFDHFKLEKKHRYLVFKIESEQVVMQVLERAGERGESWNDLLNVLKPLEHRFAVFDIKFKTIEGNDTSQIFLFNWIPDSSQTKMKMLYSTTQQILKNCFGIITSISASSVDDYNEEGIIKQITK